MLTACFYTSQHVPSMLWLKSLPTLHSQKASFHWDFSVVFSRILIIGIFPKNSIEFMSGDYFCNFITLMMFFSNHARDTLAVCFGSMSFWKIQSGRGSNFWTNVCKQSSEILIILADFVVLPVILNHYVTTTVFHSRDGVLLTVGFSIFSLNKGSIVVVRPYFFL